MGVRPRLQTPSPPFFFVTDLTLHSREFLQRGASWPLNKEPTRPDLHQLMMLIRPRVASANAHQLRFCISFTQIASPVYATPMLKRISTDVWPSGILASAACRHLKASQRPVREKKSRRHAEHTWRARHTRAADLVRGDGFAIQDACFGRVRLASLLGTVVQLQALVHTPCRPMPSRTHTSRGSVAGGALRQACKRRQQACKSPLTFPTMRARTLERPILRGP